MELANYEWRIKQNVRVDNAHLVPKSTKFEFKQPALCGTTPKTAWQAGEQSNWARCWKCEQKAKQLKDKEQMILQQATQHG